MGGLADDIHLRVEEETEIDFARGTPTRISHAGVDKYLAGSNLRGGPAGLGLSLLVSWGSNLQGGAFGGCLVRVPPAIDLGGGGTPVCNVMARVGLGGAYLLTDLDGTFENGLAVVAPFHVEGDDVSRYANLGGYRAEVWSSLRGRVDVASFDALFLTL